jgi:acyl-CoA reductase-like NAD-dependent aldehyde dehydrogenase
MEMLIGGRWQPAGNGRTEAVTSPFDGTVVGTVPIADTADIGIALDRAEAGAASWRRAPAHERMRILLRAAELADERAEQTAQIISAEAGSDGAVLSPAVVTGVDPRSAFSQDELFGPAVAEMTDTKTVVLHGRPW